jgi:hypothetical protein
MVAEAEVISEVSEEQVEVEEQELLKLALTQEQAVREVDKIIVLRHSEQVVAGELPF